LAILQEKGVLARQPSGDSLTATERYTVVAFACFVALLVLLCAWFADNRKTDIDELALYNPAYMVAQYGRLTYPVETYYDLPMIVHPPVHVGLIGLLTRLGLTWYYAEGTPTLCFLLLAICIIVRGNFPPLVKLALLFGVGLLMSYGELFAGFFGSRPEGTLHSAWFAALLLLESGRLSNWNRASLFGGAFLLTWASSLHYYATPALAGLAVYLVWAVANLGWKEARPRVLALVGGALLFGLPYMVLYIVPNWSSIVTAIRYHQAGADLSPTRQSPIGQHLDWYRQWSATSYFPLVLRQALGLGVPLMCFSTVLLAAVRSTRGIALASLPLQLGIFFFASHKPGVYLVHEIALFAAALAVGTLALLDWLVRRPQLPGWSRSAAILLAAVPLCLYLATSTVPLKSAVISAQVHPADLARAATKQILGPHARVVSRPGAWYASGADGWHDYHLDLIGPGSADYDPVRYLQNFDAAVDYPFRSGFDDDNREHKTLSGWYANGTLQLRGFYFAEQEDDLRLVLLSLHKPQAVVGYAARHGVLYRFDESPSGDHQVIAATCPALSELDSSRFNQLYPGAFIAVLELPKSNPRPPAVVVTVLSPRSALEPAGLLKKSCTETTRITGRLSVADQDALVATLRREDTPMHFYRYVEEVPGFNGVGIPASALPPDGTVPLPGVVNLAELDPAGPAAKIEKIPGILVTTPAIRGGFGVHLPIHAAERLTFPHWVRFRLRVVAGRIGLAAISNDGTIVARSGLLLPSPQPIDVAIRTPLGASDVVLFNNLDRGASKVEILDATAVASPQDGLTYRRLIDAKGASIGLGVPADLQPPDHALRLDSILNLSEAQPTSQTARVERLPQIRVTTPTSPGAFAAAFPLHLVEKVTTVAWVQLRLQVRFGRVGLAVVNSKGEIVIRTTASLLPTAESVDVALKVPALSRGANVVVFNQNLASASQVDIWDAAVVVAKEDAPLHQR
jgi:hypothetical protein